MGAFFLLKIDLIYCFTELNIDKLKSPCYNKYKFNKIQFDEKFDMLVVHTIITMYTQCILKIRRGMIIKMK